MGGPGVAHVVAGSEGEEADTDAPRRDPDPSQAVATSRTGRNVDRRRSIASLGLAFAAYLALAVVLWWNVWSTHPTQVTSCACGDASLFLWFLEWPAYAIAHGHNPFYSTALFHPNGIDMLSNTSVLGIGIVLAPVTWLFGPVATLNVASTLAPALSALAMFWLLRRWVRFWPAAFAGGLVFGFSPFTFVNLAGGHLMTSTLVLVPLIVGCLDELIFRQRHKATVVGAVLGLLVFLEFFLSTEVLMIMGICTIAAFGILLAYGVVSRRGTSSRHDEGADHGEPDGRPRHMVIGLLVAGVVDLILLAYPLWFALDGPAHLSGLVWPNIRPGTGGGISLDNLWQIHPQTALENIMQVVGGYEGRALPPAEYLGLGILVVAGAGLVCWWRDAKLWFFGVLACIAIALSLDVTNSYWVPWRVLAHIPLARSIVPGRFMIATTLCIAAMLAIVVDHTYASLHHHLGSRRHAKRQLSTAPKRATSLAAATVAIGVAAVGIVPIAGAVATNTPLTTQKVQLPRWFTEAAPHLASDQVVLAYPAPFTLVQSAMAWQAVDSLHFAMAGGGGPEGLPSRAGKERAGLEVISAASFSLLGAPGPTDANVSAVREALEGWGVTIVVIPDPAGLPRYDLGTNPALAIGLFTLAVGRPPQFHDDAWVWNDVPTPAGIRSISAPAFYRCTLSPPTAARPQAIPGCVMATSTVRT
jgi:hypothetical protein